MTSIMPTPNEISQCAHNADFLSADEYMDSMQDMLFQIVEAIDAQVEPIAIIERNATGQMRLATPSGDAFDMSQYVGAELYTYPQKTEPKPYEMDCTLFDKVEYALRDAGFPFDEACVLAEKATSPPGPPQFNNVVVIERNALNRMLSTRDFSDLMQAVGRE